MSPWGGVNIHDEAFSDRLHALPGPVAMVGVHLCKGLSPRCVGLFNGLGPAKAPFLSLAPCCLPRLAREGGWTVALYEPPAHRAARKGRLERRAWCASGLKGVCPVCGVPDAPHRMGACPELPADPGPREAALAALRAAAPCWRCGLRGHSKRACPQREARVPLVEPLVVRIDTAAIKAAPMPFDAYCEALLATVQAGGGAGGAGRELRVVPMAGRPGAQLPGQPPTWNSGRKCTWLVVAR